MAVTKILTLGESRKGRKGRHLENAIGYILAPEKTQGGRYVSAVNCQPENAYMQMVSTKEDFGKTDKRQGYHIILSFEEEKLDPAVAFEIVGKFVDEFLGAGYEAVYTVHDNTAHTHGHILFNSVNCITGKKYRYEKGDWAKILQPITNRLCEEYGLSTIDIEAEEKKRHSHYKDWNETQGKQSVRTEMIRRDLDGCIMQAGTYEEFLDLLREMGYGIKQGKYLSVCPPGSERFCRCKPNTLGEDYTQERIRERIGESSDREASNRGRHGAISKRDVSGHAEDMNVGQVQQEIIPPEDEFLRRTKLTGIQKTYYAKVCRIRKLERLPYSQAWKYRDEIRKLEKVQERYLFLIKNDIHDISRLLEVEESLREKQREADRERRAVLKEKKRFSVLFEKRERMQELLPAENSFRKGDDFFAREHEEYTQLLEELQAEGYTVEALETIQKRFDDRLAGINARRKAVRTELKMAGAMRKEFTETLNQVLTERGKAEPEPAGTEKEPEQRPVKKEDRQTKQPKR